MATRTEYHWTDCVHLHDVADALEDAAQADFICHRSTANLDHWVLMLHQAMERDRNLLAALIREREFRA